MEYELQQRSRVSVTEGADYTPAAEKCWNRPQLMGFRLLFSYLSLYLIFCRLVEDDLSLLESVGLAPGAPIALWPYSRIWAPLVTWTSAHILHVKRHVAYAPDGNSDGIFGYVQIFTFAALAVIAALVWTILDSKRIQYSRLHEGLRIFLRYALASSLLIYGMIKVVPVQFFGLPNLSVLSQRFGDLSSFSLLWNFMGYSHTYTIFTGAVEVLAGLLLFFRQTTMLGALLSAGALVNVGVLDFAYGVPEKLDVIHLVLFSVVLLGPDLRRLAGFLVFNQPTSPTNLRATLSAKWMRNGRAATKAVTIVSLILISTLWAVKIPKFYPPRSPLYGIYDVEELEGSGRVAPPLDTNTERWKKIVFETEAETWVEKSDESWQFYSTEYDLQAKTVALIEGKSRKALVYSQPGSGSVVLSETSTVGPCSLRLKRLDESKFPLMRGRFRWINGFP